MLHITDNPEFTHDVEAQVPVDGGFEVQKFRATFVVTDIDELAQLDPRAQLRRVWIGWEGVVDGAKKPIPYSEGARERLLALWYVRTAVLRVYMSAISGAKAGN